MTKNTIVLPNTQNVYQAATLFRRTGISCVIITKQGKAVGIVTERDIVYKIVANNKDKNKVLLGTIMSHPLKVVRADMTIGDAALTMKKYDIKKLPVINRDKRIIGMITESDILKAYPGLVDILIEEAVIERAGGVDAIQMYDTTLR